MSKRLKTETYNQENDKYITFTEIKKKKKKKKKKKSYNIYLFFFI